MSLKICSLEPLSELAIKQIQSKIDCNIEIIPRQEHLKEHKDSKILICRDRDNWTEIFRAFPYLQFVFIVSVGVEKLPFEELLKRNIIVANPGGINAGIMSEYAMGGVLFHSTRLKENFFNQTRCYWKKFQCVDSLVGKCLLIVGAGRTGKLIAKKAKAFSMVTIGVKRQKSELKHFDSIIRLDELEDQLPKADYIVCTIPLTSATFHLFGIKQFSLMKPECFFINLSRGNLVIQEDLVKALKGNLISGAMLDVFSKEPLSPDDELWRLPNLIITPHSSGRLENFIDKTIPYIIDNINGYLNNTNIPNKINLENGY